MLRNPFKSLEMAAWMRLTKKGVDIRGGSRQGYKVIKALVLAQRTVVVARSDFAKYLYLCCWHLLAKQTLHKYCMWIVDHKLQFTIMHDIPSKRCFSNPPHLKKNRTAIQFWVIHRIAYHLCFWERLTAHQNKVQYLNTPWVGDVLHALWAHLCQIYKA